MSKVKLQHEFIRWCRDNKIDRKHDTNKTLDAMFQVWELMRLENKQNKQQEINKMVITVDLNRFRTEFNNSHRKDNFSYEALETLFDYYDEYDSEEGYTELDIIAICCAWTEYANEKEALAAYNYCDLTELGDKTTFLITENDTYLVLEH